MPRVMLVYKLPQENDEFQYAKQGVDRSTILSEFDNYLRGRLKYEDLPEAVEEALQAARDKLHEIKNENGITEL
jgi:hypothetical protein